ncbi:glycoside hydrolase family 26 protein [Calocera viscosa TUFC12733]|uniref:Glycoside hydrolase family 26 protein n=1 Tax=Calocera viscosa (strain TUFC12733) TaxID=1330018 RepID=A0A167P656_CALVF|nr:glycoside hydrolase family 26 protein [Calocera viscosa TUFC12733]
MRFSTFASFSVLVLSASAAFHSSLFHSGARGIANHRRHHTKQARQLEKRSPEPGPQNPNAKRIRKKRCSRASNSTAPTTPGAGNTADEPSVGSNGDSSSSASSGGAGFGASYGISDGTLVINQVALGFLPDFTQTSISDMNAALPAPMPVVGDYISVGPDDLSMGNLQWHKADLLAQSTKPVYMATIMPNSLDSWDSNQADAVAEAMADLNANGVPTWVRFAYEMNGCPAWNNWGCDPDGFKTAWGTMATSLRAKAPQAKMFWAPNVDGSNNGNGNYADYWPEDDTVDIVGLSFYSFGDDQTQNTMPGADLFSSMASPFYNTYAEGKGKAFALAETSAPYHYYSGTTTPAPGGASEYDIKSQWLNELVGSATHSMYPKMIAAIWFNYLKDERDETLDFRAILGNSQIAGAVNALM